MSFFHFVGGSDSESDFDGFSSDGYDGPPDCSCGRCPGGGFGLFMSQIIFGSYAYDPWANRREKSSASEWREKLAMQKFKDVQDKVKHALMEKTKLVVKLGCLPKSLSPLKDLPDILVEHICGFAGLPEGKPRPIAAMGWVPSSAFAAGIGSSSTSRSTVYRRSARRVNYSELDVDEDGFEMNETQAAKKNDDVLEEEVHVDLTDLSIYRTGEKIVIPLTKPNEHLTAPCWRDFSRAVRINEGWDVKRVVATPEEKKRYRESRKGAVYFINVIFTVPGEAMKNDTRTKKFAFRSSQSHPSNPEDASVYLRDAVASAVRSVTGEVDQQSLKRALDAGYSKHFVLAEAARQRSDGNLKPAAKKPKLHVK
ncbi:hypothetical protein HJC23_012482 [Cyclotella cryptica]|uniref:Uncharacterized protein n=1 Tax=Cyclotella cryptica TaxID=29204 RepID=A0ABD3PAS0_9STRA|eukprot:CCRYP_016288-RB/>CCRYP_016288-RB protein AED:0.04 eAED:0.04 QI:264/1/1/1/0.66/0.75/4/2460/366